MREIDEREAEYNFEYLLDLVERGEKIVITRSGEPVARLTRELGRYARSSGHKAAADIRELARTLSLGAFDWQEWKTFRDQGRR